MARGEPRGRIVSLRVTDEELARLEKLGGPTKALRRLLNPPLTKPPAWPITIAAGRSSMVWADGTVGGTWPAVATG